jgi:hypothetical protein
MSKENDEPKLKNRFIHRTRIGNVVYEAVIFMGSPSFLGYDRDRGFFIENEIETATERLLPVTKEMVPYRPYTINCETWREIQDGSFVPDKQELYDLFYDKIDTYLDLEPKYKALISAQIFESYIQFKLNAVGYLFVEGPKDSGKSRVLDMIANLGYRPLSGLGINAANIYNYIGSDEENEGQVTILEDEIDPKNEKKTDMAERLKIYCSGYRRGGTVPRILDAGSSDRMQIYYRTFCSKAFAGYSKPKDDAFNSRCIELPMTTGEPECDELLPEDLPDFDRVKLKALVWRMKTYADKLPERELPLKGRMKEVWKCKILSVADTSAEAVMTEMSQEDIKEKEEANRETLEGRVLQAVFDLGTYLSWQPIEFRTIWGYLLRILGLDEHEYESLLEHGSSVYLGGMSTSVSYVSVGRILLSVLHGKRTLSKKVGRLYIFEEKTIMRLAKSYGLQPNDMDKLGAEESHEK